MSPCTASSPVANPSPRPRTWNQSFRRRRRRNRNPSPDARFSSSMVPSSTTPRGGVSAMIASTSVALTAQVGWPVKGVINNPPARTLVLMKKKKGSIRRKEPGIGGRPVMLVRRRVAHSAAPFILLVCGAAGVRLGAWRPVGSIAVVSEESEQESGIDALTPLPVRERLAGETPVRAAGHLPLLCSAARLSHCLPGCLPRSSPPVRTATALSRCVVAGEGEGEGGRAARREENPGPGGGVGKAKEPRSPSQTRART